MPGTMYDPNVFAVLTPFDNKNKASSAFKLPQNSRWFRRAIGGVAERPTIDSREPTPAEDAQSDGQELGAIDRLVVTFDELLKDPLSGLWLGTSPRSTHICL